jgi:hypothetical protein
LSSTSLLGSPRSVGTRSDGRRGPRHHGWRFPYLYDETRDVARAYSAACKPDTFVFDGARRLVYRGQLDDSQPRNDLPVTAADVRAAVDAVLAGRPIDPDQRPSIGCGIEWR